MTKLYIGNISFKTNEESFKKHFESFGTIKEARLMIYRGYSRGFGFVEYETEEAAKQALSANGVEFEGRKLKVAVARPPRERKPKTETKEQPKEKKEGEAPKNTNRPRGFQGRRRPYRGPQRGRRFPNRRNNRRFNRKPRDQKPKEESENILFVKNISFTCKDEDLKTLFKEYNVTEAKVITFKNRDGELRSKGFGFVDVKTKEDQTKAIEKVNGTTHMDRKIIVTKAYKRPEQPKKE